MEEPADSPKPETEDAPKSSSLVRTTSRRSIPGRFTSGRSTPGGSTSGKSPSGRSCTSGISTSGRSTSVRSTPDRSITPEPPPVPPATYHWEEVRRKRSVGGYPWTHLNKEPFDEKTFVKHERDHVYEPVAPAKQAGPSKDDSRHFLRIPLTEELVMADDTGSESEDEQRKSEEDEEEESEEDDDDDDDDVVGDDDNNNVQKKRQSDESIYEGENENSSVGDADTSTTRMKMFQQKVKMKTDMLRTKLQGVTKRKPKQKIVVDEPGSGEKSRRKFGHFATLPKKFTFNAPKVNFSTTFNNFTRNSASADVNESSTDDTKSGRFSLHRFAFSKTSSESPKPSKSAKIGASRLSIPGLRSRTWSDASKVSKPDNPKPKLMDFGTYPRIFSKRRKTANAANKAKTPPPSNVGDGKPSERKDSFRRRFFRSHKESTPAPTEEQMATLAVEEELDESHVSKESLAEFGDSDLQEVISLSDDGRSKQDTKSLSEHRAGVIEEIDSDEFFLRKKGLSRGDVHISNYLSSEIRDVFRSNRTWSMEGVNRSSNVQNGNGGTATPVRPSRTNSLRRPVRSQQTIVTSVRVTDRFSTMPKSFGGSKTLDKPEDDMPENIITSQTFEPSSQSSSGIPSTFRVPWRTVQNETPAVTNTPPKPPTRHLRMSKFSTFDTRSMIDLSRKRSQSQSGFLPPMNFSDAAPKAPLRKSRTSLAGSDRDITILQTTMENRRSWMVNSGVPTPPMRRSRASLTADVDDEEPRSTTIKRTGTATPPTRPPPPSSRVTVGYATVDKQQSLLVPPQSPVRHRRKKSYEMIKSQEFGAFFTIPRSYNSGKTATDATAAVRGTDLLPPAPPSRPTRAYNTLGPSRPLRHRLPVREHEYGDVADNRNASGPTAAATTDTERERRHTITITARSSSLDDADGSTKVLYSGDVIEKMKLRPLPSPPAPPRKTKSPGGNGNNTPEHQRRRNTDSALVPFLDRRETSATSSDDFFADVSRALLVSTAKKTITAGADDVSIGVQTDPMLDSYELDDMGSCCSVDSDRPTVSRASSTAAERPVSRASAVSATKNVPAERPASRMSTNTEYMDRPTSRIENGYAMVPDVAAAGVVCAQRLNVAELQVGKMIVADVRSQRMGVDHVSGSILNVGHLAAAMVTMTPETDAAAPRAVLPTACLDDLHRHLLQDDAASVPSSRVSSSMYPEVDSDEDRSSVLAAPTPPRRRSKPPTSRSVSSAAKDRNDDNARPSAVDLTAANATISELSCQLFQLCHSNVCNLFKKVVQQVVPEDTEKRRDLQAALCFLSIILAGLLILGFGNEKTIHHHHWDFQFPPPHQ